MSEPTIDRLSRRASFTALGAAGVAGLLTHAPAAESKQSVSRKAKQKCKRQVNPCLSVFGAACNGNADCLDDVQRCSPLIRNCDFTAFLLCTAPQP